MSAEEITEREIDAAIAELSRREYLEDQLEDQLIASECETSEDEPIEDGDYELSPHLSLANIPVEEWGSIAVSPLSFFRDNYWDFSCYPNAHPKGAKLNFDYDNTLGINVTEPHYVHWLHIAKALCFYSVPHFAISTWIRSYGSLATRKAKLLRLFELFRLENLYLGVPNSPSFRTINDLSRETVVAYIDRQPSLGLKWEIAFIFQFWQNLSKSGLLPLQYALAGTFVEKADVSLHRLAYDNSSNPFAPIPLDDYAEIINYCLTMVNEFGEDVIWLYQTYYPTLVGAFDHPDRMKLRPTGFSTGSSDGIEAFKTYTPKLIGGEAWWPIQLKHRVVDDSEFIEYSKVATCIASLIDACCVLILATTGMRRSEVSNLRSGCVTYSSEGAWLTFTVFKTSVASQGDSITIPIPDATARAIELMERLFADARKHGGHEYLFAVITRQFFGNKAHGSYPERAVKRVAQAAGIDDVIFPHRFRKSLAMYLIYQDPRNIDLIRHLFSHRSLKMTLRYILSLPGVHSEIRKTVIDQNVELLSEIVHGVLRDRIGGIGGNRVKETIDGSPVFKAKLQDDGKETLIQYVESLLDQGIQLLHRTNLAICLKTPGLTEDSPCVGKNEHAITKLHPNLYACDPLNCRYAAFVERDIPALESEIVFHNNLTHHSYCSEEQRQFSEQRIKDAFKRLSEIDEAHALQFMVEVANG